MKPPLPGPVPAVAAFVLFLFHACGPAQTPERTETVTPDALTFLALGDSYTIGESVDSVSRWPVQLVDILRSEGAEVEDPEIVARTGWTTAELMAGIEERDPKGPYDLVSLLIGVNNQYRGLPLEEYRSEFADLLHAAIAFAGGDPAKVLVVSIPDWSATPFAGDRNREEISAQIDTFNEAARSTCIQEGVAFVSVTEVSRRASTEPNLVAADGLHPSGAMYGLWVQAVLPEAHRILGSG